MANFKPLFKIKDDGFLYVSYDNGCTWEAIGEVKGPQGEQGEQGAQGETGEQGEDGTNGTDGHSPYINPTTGHWMVFNDSTEEWEDTGIMAQGSDGTVRVASSEDIAVVGTPSVTEQIVDNTLYIQFHELKGEPGEAGSKYRAGEHMEINEPEEAGLLPSIDCTLQDGDDIHIAEDDSVNVINPYGTSLIDSTHITDYGISYNANPAAAIYSNWDTAPVSTGTVSCAGITASTDPRYMLLCAAGINSNSWAVNCLHIIADEQGTGNEITGEVGMYFHPNQPADDGKIRTTFPWKVFVTTETVGINTYLTKRLYLEIPKSFVGNVHVYASKASSGRAGYYYDDSSSTYKSYDNLVAQSSAATPLLASYEGTLSGIDIQSVVSMTVGTTAPEQPTAITTQAWLIQALIDKVNALETVVQQLSSNNP